MYPPLRGFEGSPLLIRPGKITFVMVPDTNSTFTAADPRLFYVIIGYHLVRLRNIVTTGFQDWCNAVVALSTTAGFQETAKFRRRLKMPSELRVDTRGRKKTHEYEEIQGNSFKD